MATLDLTGSHVALVTPLTADREIHHGDVEVLVRRAVADGARGVLVAGSTGEGSLLEPEQRADLTRAARHTLDQLDTGATLLAGATAPTVATLDADVASLAAAGADAVLVLPPATYPLSTEELVDLHLGVADRADIPTLVYHLPQLTGSWLTAEGIRELAGHPGIVGLKDSSTDIERKLSFVEVAATVDGFGLLTGHAGSLRRTLAAGANGSITAVANLRQRQVVALHHAVEDGDEAEAERHQSALARLSDELRQVGSTAAVYKAALQLEGVIEERWCRPPLHSLGPGRLDRVRTALVR